MEYEDEKKKSTMEKAHLGWTAASCQSHELCDLKKKKRRVVYRCQLSFTGQLAVCELWADMGVGFFVP